jgi:integration host factor subunit beta
MRKSDLIQRIALLNPTLPEPACRTLVETLFTAIADHLRNGGAIELRGFGRFFLSQHAPKTVHNPRTGELLSVREFLAVRFRPSKSICTRINAEPSAKF